MRLVKWLVDAAYPLWSDRGIDPRNGGFAEVLSQEGVALPHPRRARVHPRQIYAFAQARTFGWPGDVTGIVSRGIDYFITYYQRRDGLYRAMANADGAPLDERALLYDQALPCWATQPRPLRSTRAENSKDGRFHCAESSPLVSAPMTAPMTPKNIRRAIANRIRTCTCSRRT